jgi:hypothetical protein
MNTTANPLTAAFIDGAFWSLVDVAKTIDRYATPATTWYCRTFFSQDSRRTYEAIGQIIGGLMVLAIMAGMIARQYVQHWVDAQVEAATDPFDFDGNPLGKPAAVALLPTAGTLPWFVFPETMRSAYRYAAPQIAAVFAKASL